MQKRIVPLVRALLQKQNAHERMRRLFPSPLRLCLAVATTGLLALLICIHLWPNRISLKLGDVSDITFLAQRTVRYEDTSATQLLRADAARQTETWHEQIPDALAQSRDAALNVFAAIEEVAFLRRTAPRPDSEETSSKDPSSDALRLSALQIRQRTGIVLPSESLRALLSADAATRRSMALRAVAATEQTMGGAIRAEDGDLARAQNNVRTAIQQGGDTPLNRALADVVTAALRPNLRVDARRTEQEQRRAQEKIPPQMRRLTAGTPVIREGDRVTQQQLDAFAALGLQNPTLEPPIVAAIVSVVCLMVGLIIAYIRTFHPDLYRNTPSLLLLSLLSLFSVLGLKLGTGLLGLPQGGVHQFGYLGMMCVASTGMIAALLINPSIATLMVAILSVVAGLLVNEPRFTFITMGSSLAGIVAASTLRNRNDLIRAVLLVCGMNAVLNGLGGVLSGDTGSEILAGVFWGLTSGLFSLVVFWIGTTVFERLFGITTHLRLLELSDPATPILQEFRLRVPGTYAHSLMVGNLAHAAAEAIGADALLCRVAAYYHDLGKMNRPQFFIENQGMTENIHDRLTPSLSALILTAHVKDSVAIAETVGLPRRIRDIIGQHHGTTLMKFFYNRASANLHEGERGGRYLETQFRYPGPKPQSREAAILMLADTVEAASRTLHNPTPARVQEFVAALVEDKRADDQLDECDLTLRDLKKVEEVFVRTLSGVLHGRIEYPRQKAGVTSQEGTMRGAKRSRNAVPMTPQALPELSHESLADAITLVNATPLFPDTDDPARTMPALLGLECEPPGPRTDFGETYADRGERDARIDDARMDVTLRRRIGKVSRRRRTQ